MLPRGATRRRTFVGLALFGFAMTFVWSLVMPNLSGPDENLHLDLVHEMAHEHYYPLSEQYRVTQRVVNVRKLVRHGTEFGHNSLVSDAVPRQDRPAFTAGEDRRGSTNQLTQHPPLGWTAPVVGAWLVSLVSDPADWSYDSYLLLLRFFTALPMLCVGPLIYATAKRLHQSHAVCLTAAILPFAIPQLTYDSGVITNDTLLIVAGAAFAYLAARIVTRDFSVRTGVWLGIVIGLALLMKAWGLLLMPTAAFLYGALWLRTAASRREIWRSCRSAAVVALGVGGWWWVRNVIVYGEIQPHRAVLKAAPDGYVPLSYQVWAPRVMGWLLHRFWGWFGPFGERVLIPGWVAVGASVLAVALITLTFVSARSPGIRLFGIAAVGLVVVNSLEVLRQARALHVEHALMQGVQGRYLFIVVPMLCVLVAVGAGSVARDASRYLPWAGLAGVFVMQAFGLTSVVANYWGAKNAGLIDRFRSLASWSALPPAVFVVVCCALLAAAAWVVIDFRPGRLEEPS